jgi:chromate reductase
MHKILTRVRLVGLPGSLRKASFSRATLVGLRNHLPHKVSLDILDPHLPLYNEDHDRADGPEEIHRFRQAIEGSDGLIIATPEYNHGIPGVFEECAGLAVTPLWQVLPRQQTDIGHIDFSRLYRRRAASRASQ